ncbi:hypothetical protein LCGC14_1720220 [marine sediment metagenome]|uniref:Uncharacterized protein n=1 Tax=marine sediment metagenome TaxID=412755 RepID=A0A0F9JT41_9ZZZZ
MGNMSYCRFQNTLGDLLDCEEALGEMPDTIDLSPEENRSMKQLIKLCGDIHHDFEDFE